MEKFSACRKRASSIHFFSSTRTRCIIAICPAGPPKLTQPILSHVRKASPKFGVACFGRASISGGFRWPVVPFPGRKAQPGEECIIKEEASPQEAVVVVAGKRREAD